MPRTKASATTACKVRTRNKLAALDTLATNARGGKPKNGTPLATSQWEE